MSSVSSGRWTPARSPSSGWASGTGRDRRVELADKHAHSGVFCDATGAAGSLLPELEMTVETVSAREHANACGLLYDMVDQNRLRHLGQPELTAAVKGAAKRPLGDAWAWSRKTSAVDISPLVAATLALWGLAAAPSNAWVGW
jgi:hypothetical protein